MTSKLSWIFFVPFTLAAIALKVIQLVMPSEDGVYLFGLNKLQMDYIALGCIVVVFLFALIFCLVDRKISPYYITGRNIAAGIFAVISALLIAADGAYQIFNAFVSGDFKLLAVLEMAFAVLSAIALVVLGLSLFSQNSDSKKFALFYLLPAFFFAMRLINSFVGITTQSIRTADVLVVAVYIFVLMFWFNYAVLLSLTEAKNAVKSTLIYGLPAVAAGLAYGVYELMKNFSLTEPLMMLPAAEVLMLSLFIFAILVEITAKAKRREEVNVRGLKANREKEAEEELLKNPPEDNIEGFVINSQIENPDELNPSTYYAATDTEGYLYQEVKRDEDIKGMDVPPLEESSEGYILEKTEDAYAEEDKKNQTPSYMSRLDEIDKLILEISEDN